LQIKVGEKRARAMQLISNLISEGVEFDDRRSGARRGMMAYILQPPAIGRERGIIEIIITSRLHYSHT
jgi:hypothetical protein